MTDLSFVFANVSSEHGNFDKDPSTLAEEDACRVRQIRSER